MSAALLQDFSSEGSTAAGRNRKHLRENPSRSLHIVSKARIDSDGNRAQRPSLVIDRPCVFIATRTAIQSELIARVETSGSEEKYDLVPRWHQRSLERSEHWHDGLGGADSYRGRRRASQVRATTGMRHRASPAPSIATRRLSFHSRDRDGPVSL